MMPPDTAERMRRALDRLASNPRAVQTLARAIDFTEQLAQIVDRRAITIRRAAELLVCAYAKPLPEGVAPTDRRSCWAPGAEPACRACRVRVELLEEFGL